MADPETYEVFAVRYGTLRTRLRRDNFIMPPDSHDTPMPLDYFVWVVRNANRTILVDTGFDAAEGARRGREVFMAPAEAIRPLEIDASAIQDVIITHMHYDHAGTIGDFAGARFHIQESELRYVTGPCMCHEPIRHAYTGQHVCDIVLKLFDGRVGFHDGVGEVAPGITVHHVGGHTMGLQCVRVLTERGWLVLASDASHFYDNMNGPAPFPIVYNLADMLAGYETMRGLASSPEQIVPGHDPQVMRRYPAAAAGLEDSIVRLDVTPVG